MSFIVATVLTVYGIETLQNQEVCSKYKVATVLTVYGIETVPTLRDSQETRIGSLQQYLPFTVLKHLLSKRLLLENNVGCNSTYRLRY